MPTYEFEDLKDEGIVELVMPMSEAVPIGEEIEIEGRKLRRVVSSGTKFGGDMNYGVDTRITGYQFAPWKGREWGHKNFSQQGEPQFTSVREAQDFAKKVSENDPHKDWTFDRKKAVT